jgi:hypothetical protein
MRSSSSDNYRPYGPRDPAVETRLERFKQMNAFIMARGGWVTSLPGDATVRFECLPGSGLPDELGKMGHYVIESGEGERILPTAISQQFVVGTNGELSLLTGASTRPVTMVVQHAGICRVKRYVFELIALGSKS